MAPIRTAFPFLELAAMSHGRAGVTMRRKRFVHVDDPQAIARWRQRHDNTDLFASIGRYAAPQLSAPCLHPFVLDIDAPNLEAAREAVLRSVDLLEQRVGIRPSSIELFFSGAKGFHVQTPLEVFGQPEDVRVNVVWRRLAAALQRHDVEHIDTSVYDRTHLLRLVNSRHSRSGLFKVPVEFEELRDLGLDHVRELAQAPRDENTMAVPEECPKAVGWIQEALARVQQRDQPTTCPVSDHGWQTPACVRAIERELVLEDGTRHATYYTLARFYASTGMAPQEAINRLTEIDTRHPIRDPDYLERVVRNAWRKPGFIGCPNPTLKSHCNPACCPRPPLRTSAEPAPDNTQPQRRSCHDSTQT